MLEKQIEAKVVKWAKFNGFFVLKINGLGQRSWPDRLFICPPGQHIWIEFKRPGGVLSEGQKTIIEGLQEAGATVHVCYDAPTAISILEKYL